MIRLVGVVLVIWGLIVQPLMAAMPDMMAHHGMDAVAAFNADETVHEYSDHHDHKVANKTDEAQSYGSVTDSESSSETHDDCVDSGDCCGVCTASLNHEVIVPCEQQINLPFVSLDDHLVLGILSAIYHPPKQA